MLTEERQTRIIALLKHRGSVTATELMTDFDASESTIRRDLNTLADQGRLKKVHGGAIAISEKQYNVKDDEVFLRRERNTREKLAIARYAASTIKDNDFVYIDAGTTTFLIADFLKANDITFVTNGIEHARMLTSKGYTVYLLGGEYKAATEAVVGAEAIDAIEKYNFTKGFFGTNGIHIKSGLTTPEMKEAMLKKKAISAAGEAYIMADHSKFGQVSAVTFADIAGVTILTDRITEEKYKNYKNIVEVIE